MESSLNISKANRNYGKLVKKQVTGKDGKTHTVWVDPNKGKPNKERAKEQQKPQKKKVIKDADGKQSKHSEKEIAKIKEITQRHTEFETQLKDQRKAYGDGPAMPKVGAIMRVYAKGKANIGGMLGKIKNIAKDGKSAIVQLTSGGFYSFPMTDLQIAKSSLMVDIQKARAVKYVKRIRAKGGKQKYRYFYTLKEYKEYQEEQKRIKGAVKNQKSQNAKAKQAKEPKKESTKAPVTRGTRLEKDKVPTYSGKQPESLKVEVTSRPIPKPETKPQENNFETMPESNKEPDYKKELKRNIEALKNKKYKTANDEKLIAIYEKRLKADISKYKEGDGVQYNLLRQTNKGVIVSVDPSTGIAKVKLKGKYADHDEYGNYIDNPIAYVHIGDLKKYNALTEKQAKIAEVVKNTKKPAVPETQENNFETMPEVESKPKVPEPKDVTNMIGKKLLLHGKVVEVVNQKPSPIGMFYSVKDGDGKILPMMLETNFKPLQTEGTKQTKIAEVVKNTKKPAVPETQENNFETMPENVKNLENKFTSKEIDNYRMKLYYDYLKNTNTLNEETAKDFYYGYSSWIRKNISEAEKLLGRYTDKSDTKLIDDYLQSIAIGKPLDIKSIGFEERKAAEQKKEQDEINSLKTPEKPIDKPIPAKLGGYKYSDVINYDPSKNIERITSNLWSFTLIKNDNGNKKPLGLTFKTRKQALKASVLHKNNILRKFYNPEGYGYSGKDISYEQEDNTDQTITSNNLTLALDQLLKLNVTPKDKTYLERVKAVRDRLPAKQIEQIENSIKSMDVKDKDFVISTIKNYITDSILKYGETDPPSVDKPANTIDTFPNSEPLINKKGEKPQEERKEKAMRPDFEGIQIYETLEKLSIDDLKDLEYAELRKIASLGFMKMEKGLLNKINQAFSPLLKNGDFPYDSKESAIQNIVKLTNKVIESDQRKRPHTEQEYRDIQAYRHGYGNSVMNRDL